MTREECVNLSDISVVKYMYMYLCLLVDRKVGTSDLTYLKQKQKIILLVNICKLRIKINWILNHFGGKCTDFAEQSLICSVVEILLFAHCSKINSFIYIYICVRQIRVPLILGSFLENLQKHGFLSVEANHFSASLTIYQICESRLKSISWVTCTLLK